MSEDWIHEKGGTNDPPKEPPKTRSVGNKIHNVDVSKCMYYQNGWCTTINYENQPAYQCNNQINCNCFFKRLQRKEIELKPNACKYYENGYCYCIDARDCEGYITDLIQECEEKPNCYYKQLYRN